VRGRRSGGGWSWSCRRAARGRGKAHGTIGWAGGRPKVRGRRCGALTARADGVGSALATSCRDGLAHGEAPVDDDSWHTRTVAQRCLRWLIDGRGTTKKSSSGNARIDRGVARWRGREVERCGAESHEEEEGKCGFALSPERIRAAAIGARGGVGQGGAIGIGGGGGPVATMGPRGRKTPWWLTCGPSVPFNLICFSKAPTSKFTNMIFRICKKC
jgi:hypothetical protein